MRMQAIDKLNSKSNVMAVDTLKAEKIRLTVCKVPRGKVSSYGFIADLAGLPGRARMVGSVLRNTPESLNVPWHRILKSNGQLAFDKESKQATRQLELLRDEGVVVLNNRVKLKQYGWNPQLGELMEMEY